MLPALDSNGNLPPGIHQLDDWQAFLRVYATTPHRKRLAGGLESALKSLRDAGCRTAYVDGSFISSKSAPSDYDGCWDPTGVDPAKLDPVLLVFDAGRATQKAKFGGELFPETVAANRAGDTNLKFLQTDKSTGQAKGIVAIDLRTINS